MSLTLTGENFVYHIEAFDSPSDPGFFHVKVRASYPSVVESDAIFGISSAFDPEGRETQITTADIAAMDLTKEEIPNLLLRAPSTLSDPSEDPLWPYGNASYISDLLSSTGRMNIYTQKFAELYPVQFEIEPMNDDHLAYLYFRFPKTVVLDYTPADPDPADPNPSVTDHIKAIMEQNNLTLTPGQVVAGNVFIDRRPGSDVGYLYVPENMVTTFADSAVFGDIGSGTPIAEIEEFEEQSATERETRRRQLQSNDLTLNEQAILLFRIGDIMSINRARRERSPIYKRLACLDYKTNGKLDPANVSNHITSHTGLASLFEELKPVHLSAMVPKVRVFKAYTEQEMKKRKADGKPRELVEYEFEEYPDTNILKESLGTNTGVGITSFSWDFNGENQVSAQRQVKAKMQLRVQSIDALDKERTSQSAVDKDGKPVKYRFTEIIMPRSVREQEARSKQQQSSIKPRRLYETRIIVEYGVDQSASASGIWADHQPLLEAVKSLRLILNLSTSVYNFDTSGDGSILIDIDFIGRVDSKSSDQVYANILSNGTSKKNLAKAEEMIANRKIKLESANEMQGKIDEKRSTISDLKKKEEEFRERGEENPNAAADLAMRISLENEIPQLSKQVVQLQETFRVGMSDDEYIEMISREYDKIRVYQNIINTLFESNGLDVLQIDPTNILKKDTTKILESSENIVIGASAENVDTHSEPCLVTDLVDRSLSDQAMEIRKESFIQKIKNTILPLFSDHEYYIKYFYYGDLVEAVLKNMAGNTEDLDIRTLLGPITIENNMFSSNTFTSKLSFGTDGKITLTDEQGTQATTAQKEYLEKQAKQEAELLAASKRGDLDTFRKVEAELEVSSTVLNLADVPISLNLFLQWFSKRIVDKSKTSYTLKDFIIDSVNGLIFSALEAESTKLILPMQKRKIVVTSFDAPLPLSSELDVFGFGRDESDTTNYRMNSSMLVEDYYNIKGNRTLPLFAAGNKQRNPKVAMADYFLVYAESTDYLRTFRTQEDYNRDIRQGIYHLHAGRDAGVVQDLKLSAEAIEGFEEMHMIEAAKGLPVATKRVYRVSATIFGTPIFRPGHMVFVKAAAYGSESLLREFGLMGYYSVVSTSSRVAAGEWQTTLELSYQGPG